MQCNWHAKVIWNNWRAGVTQRKRNEVTWSRWSTGVTLSNWKDTVTSGTGELE